jgi:hypothetical protein
VSHFVLVSYLRSYFVWHCVSSFLEHLYFNSHTVNEISVRTYSDIIAVWVLRDLLDGKQSLCCLGTFCLSLITRWFKYDRDKLWLVYTQIVPVIFEPPCISEQNARLCKYYLHPAVRASVGPENIQLSPYSVGTGISSAVRKGANIWRWPLFSI